MPVDIRDGDRFSVVRLTCQAELALARGDVNGAVAAAQLGVRLAERVSVPFLLPNLHIVLAVSAVRQANMTDAVQYARLLGEDALLGWTDSRRGQCAWAAAQVVEADQGPEGVAHLVERLITDDWLNRRLILAQPAAAAWLIRVARAIGEERLVLICAERARELAKKTRGFRAIEAATLHAEGLFAGDPEKLQDASIIHLDRWASASASEDQAKICAAEQAGGDRAVEALKYAAAVYAEAGAARDLARVASKLRDLGVGAGRVMRPVRRNGQAMVALTDTEFAVANLVSQGLTNGQVGRQLYISTHTVAFHLKKIFRKMDISSRVELASTWVSVSSD
jgi:DNA-binding CsgD family transcriptional regulator